MEKVYLKYKILVNGLGIHGKYKIDGFTLKEGKFKKNIHDIKYNYKANGININMNTYLSSCLNYYDDCSYNYFESDELIEIYTKIKVSKKNIKEILKNDSSIIGRAYDFEDKLRILLNIPILFQTICIEFYDENKKYIMFYIINKPISYWNRINYNLEPNIIHEHNRSILNYSRIKDTKNPQLGRAIEFYCNSFDSEKIPIRYILVFSSLEAMFNLDGIKVKEKLAKYSAKLLSEEKNDDYKKIYSDIKKLYKKRCDYVHGSKNGEIFLEDEKLLRDYVRKIIIAYWLIIVSTGKSANQILKYLDSDERLSVYIRLVISTLNSHNLSEQQHKAVEIIENEIGRQLPRKLKCILFSKCDN